MKNLIKTGLESLRNNKYNEGCDLIAQGLNLEYSCEFLKNDFHFANDKDKRDIYKITLQHGQREYSFEFGQSINKSGFYAKQGVKITEIGRKYLDNSNTAIKANYYKHGLMQFVGQDFIHRPIAPTLYDVLACLQKYDVGTFEGFCSEFGYDIDSKSAEKIYNSVFDEYRNMQALFNDEELEILREIN